MSKTRSDSSLAQLTTEQQIELYQLLSGGMGYKTAVEHCRVEYGIKTHMSSLHNAFEKWAKQDSRDRILRNVAAAQAMHETAAKSLPLMDQATDSLLHQLAFEAAQARDSEAMGDYLDAILSRQRAALQADRLALDTARFEEAKRKAAKFDQAEEVVRNEKLSVVEQANIMRELFGMPPLEEPA